MKKKEQSFKAGMYLLETLTSGMYNDPLSIYREYIQNAVDSVDLLPRKKKEGHVISIDLDPFDKKISISDNGVGIPAEKAEAVLGSIGSSEKIGSKQRGFRGIGRLGGIAFARKVIFSTKARGNTIESVQEWDCQKLRNLLAKSYGAPLSLEDLFKQVTSFSQHESSRKVGESFFKVVLEGVESFRNYIFDIAKIKDYLCQVAPLSFHPNQFSHGPKISTYLSENLSHYECYSILLNGEPVYQQYRDVVRVTGKVKDDTLEDVEFFRIKPNGKAIAYGWYGKRRDLLGAVHRGDKFAGIRVKAGNIMIGNQHLLDRCFREARFNGYVVGEIHIDDPDLIPNSRRDDFVDNHLKNHFYNEVEKVIGLPLSKEIRMRSKLKSEGKQKHAPDEKKVTTSSCITSCNSTKSKNETPPAYPANSSKVSENIILQRVLESCSTCSVFKQILESSLEG